MTLYNVYLHREIRVTILEIDADSPEAAASIARGTATGFADRIDDCGDLSASVDVVNDGRYEHCLALCFQSDRLRPPAPEWLRLLERATGNWKSPHEYAEWKKEARDAIAREAAKEGKPV